MTCASVPIWWMLHLKSWKEAVSSWKGPIEASYLLGSLYVYVHHREEDSQKSTVLPVFYKYQWLEPGA